MNIFNIIGPRMIGPSSSHTAGAVRIGNVAHKIMQGAKPIEVKFELAGSFKATYKGHGTDKALIAGLLGYETDDAEIRDIFEIADKEGLKYEFVGIDLENAHPNTAIIHFLCENGQQGCVRGASIGGGNIRIESINGMNFPMTTDNPTILVVHNDRPGVIARVTSLLSDRYSDANICNITLERDKKGGIAIMKVELDEPTSKYIEYEIGALDDVLNVVVIE
ncbi:L-serine ammonia-lyase, iron-sulfur-dependent subunit beta [Helcococcus kunzii]|uniref:L-serine deaminase n=1 Tax=Helcococcus kunzii ATCC 51366 TaxID=883114 RepID=H3NP75_9FIRM|nr:L-serine ammonia-lyase, iron-sulfur-dependent subunit beta [Helcococcus kunzii]EHR33537.1 L-serine dehydratase, iron-sulfur-dependent, beta subunit [Helcococcus kunzii ATCC 51366]MCT1795799.1 L-serine ammonia-lyase, iron-sulfur-dependent subunit beta [Helcococcus kunzii]MCT1989378.1 L-serine ammonia-lyase, iron-sulfur-dependent subunit beta [Helcococcus kunzii]QZO75748.1 L-serine ammonia-lyase, iron-sulfur-dependent subunit beta [Helcococcus kunzii]